MNCVEPTKLYKQSGPLRVAKFAKNFCFTKKVVQATTTEKEENIGAC
jgi:hypothetical protein